jgi:hypothetical protein
VTEQDLTEHDLTEHDLTEPEGSTGDPRVDAATKRLADVQGRPAADHVDVFEDVHRRLQEALTGLDGET